MKIKVFSVSAGSNFKSTALYKSLGTSTIISKSDEISLTRLENNTLSLSKVYNRVIDDFINDFDALCLVHDDVYINCGDFGSKVNKYLTEFDIIGLAGTKTADFGYHNKPMLWHLISERKDQLGCVAHGTPEDYFYTSFGPLNKQALLIDGLFIGINLKKLGNLRFDESNPARFHFYDLIFSMDAAKAKLKTGVVDIPVIHQSPGLKEFTDEWKAGEKYFKEKYKAYSGNLITL